MNSTSFFEDFSNLINDKKCGFECGFPVLKIWHCIDQKPKSKKLSYQSRLQLKMTSNMKKTNPSRWIHQGFYTGIWNLVQMNQIIPSTFRVKRNDYGTVQWSTNRWFLIEQSESFNMLIFYQDQLTLLKGLSKFGRAVFPLTPFFGWDDWKFISKGFTWNFFEALMVRPKSDI